MLRIHQSKGGASGAARYYTDSLKKSDYYMEGLDIDGRWHGMALEKLSLTTGDSETAAQFTALLNNRHPVTGNKLTPRTNKDDNRTVGWDHVFSVPKSASTAWAITGDAKIIKAFRESVAETMSAIEARVETRVRIGGKNENRLAGGGIVWTEFLHTTTRPLSDGLPDPHLHIHAYLHNVCYDNTEGKFKAINLKSIKDNAYYFEALHDSILAKKLEEIGYPVERTAKGWEVTALNDRALIDKFSRRTLEIDKLAADRGITDPKEKEKLGQKTRNRKSQKLTPEKLVEAWKSRLTPEELRAIQNAHRRENTPSKAKVTVGEALDFAEGKCFQRESVVTRERLVSAALKFGIGCGVLLEDVNREMARRDYIERRIGNENKVTTPAQVVEEVQLVQQWRQGQGKHAPLIKGKISFTDQRLSEEQRDAVHHLLKSHDQISCIRGRAGTGKTTLLREVRTQLAHEGIRMIALAPSAAASRGVMRADGFVGAETVARFLVDPELQKKARGQVLLVDEAGLIGNKDLTRLLSIVGPSTRVILSGDTGQHSPQQRGDALRLLESVGLKSAHVHHIIRQKEDGYRKAVKAIADGNLSTAFARLNGIGAIREYKHDGDRYRAMALDYAQYLAETGVPPLLVSPSHKEGKLAVEAVRTHLRELGKLGVERSYLQFRDLRWEDVEKTRAENFEAGQVVQFHQNAPKIKRGSTLPVLGVDKASNVWIEAPTGKPMRLDLSRSHHFRVFQIEQIAFAPGDQIKLTNGGKDLNGRRIENGMLAEVKSIGKGGNLTLSNGIKLDGRFGHWAHGYDTSHSSQGKTARDVLVAQSAMSSKAASLEQFYVTASRGERRIQIYTDSSSKLMEAVAKSSHRMSALEFTGLDKELINTGGLAGKKWTERLINGKELQGKNIKMHIDKLLKERKPVMKDGEKENFFQSMLELQRARSGPDGRSRSKGQPHSGKPKRKEKLGSIDPRRSGLPEAVSQEAKPVSKHEAKPQKDNGEKKSVGNKEAKAKGKKNAAIRQTEKEMKAGDRQLNEVVGRSKRGAETIKNGAGRPIKFGKQETTLGKLANNPKTKAAQVKNQATQKPPAPKPPSPVIRRGR